MSYLQNYPDILLDGTKSASEIVDIPFWNKPILKLGIFCLLIEILEYYSKSFRNCILLIFCGINIPNFSLVNAGPSIGN